MRANLNFILVDKYQIFIKLINEEQLLSRIELLESQLALVGNRNITNDELRKEIQGGVINKLAEIYICTFRNP